MDYRGLLGLEPRVSGREQPSFYRDVEGEFGDINQGLLGMLPIGGVLKEKKLRKIWGKMGNDGKKAFTNLADSQRGEPEIAMLHAQRKTPGVMSYMLEHIGDLTHRMSEGAKWGIGRMDSFAGGMGREMVTEKLDKTLNTLKSGYGFRREFNENMQNNAKRNNISETKQWELADKKLRKYVDEHKKLPVYNEAQWLGREAAISLGEKKFEKTIKMLERLQHKTNNPDKWFIEATKVVRDKSSGDLLQYKPSPKSGLLD